MAGPRVDPSSDHSPAIRPHSGSLRWRWATLGAFIGVSIQIVILALSFGKELDPNSTADWRAMEYIVFGFFAAFLSMTVSCALVWWPRFRAFGVGLALGAGFGLLGGILWGMALTESPITT